MVAGRSGVRQPVDRVDNRGIIKSQPVALLPASGPQSMPRHSPITGSVAGNDTVSAVAAASARRRLTTWSPSINNGLGDAQRSVREPLATGGLVSPIFMPRCVIPFGSRIYIVETREGTLGTWSGASSPLTLLQGSARCRQGGVLLDRGPSLPAGHPGDFPRVATRCGPEGRCRHQSVVLPPGPWSTGSRSCRCYHWCARLPVV